MKSFTLGTSDYLDAALIESYNDLDAQIGMLSYIAACIVDGNTNYAVEKLKKLISRGKQIVEAKEADVLCPKCANVMTESGDVYTCLDCGMDMIKNARANQHGAEHSSISQ
jgi:predicted RNA-binding Zn-ribbon protein involved in translation (DUF1610 family)